MSWQQSKTIPPPLILDIKWLVPLWVYQWAVTWVQHRCLWCVWQGCDSIQGLLGSSASVDVWCMLVTLVTTGNGFTLASHLYYTANISSWSTLPHCNFGCTIWVELVYMCMCKLSRPQCVERFISNNYVFLLQKHAMGSRKQYDAVIFSLLTVLIVTIYHSSFNKQNNS